MRKRNQEQKTIPLSEIEQIERLQRPLRGEEIALLVLLAGALVIAAAFGGGQ